MLKSAPPAVLAMPLLALTTLVNAMLPNDPNAELRLARTLQLDVEMFREFRTFYTEFRAAYDFTERQTTAPSDSHRIERHGPISANVEQGRRKPGLWKFGNRIAVPHRCCNRQDCLQS